MDRDVFFRRNKNCEKYGYKFKILGGYIFESSNLFKDYIETLYTIKETSSKDDSMYLISKILMNGLYGWFGINPWLGKCEFISKTQYKSLINEGLLKVPKLKKLNLLIIIWFNIEIMNNSVLMPFYQFL